MSNEHVTEHMDFVPTGRPNEVTGVMWQMTPALRWAGKELQQAWRCVQTGAVDWRKVPRADTT